MQPKKIFIDDASIPVEEGDRITRELPNGLVESYLVMDRGFYDSFGGIPAHYQIEVRKESRPSTPGRSPTTVIYNLHGANSRVNIQSTDSSINVVEATPERLFDELREALKKHVSEDQARQQLLKGVALMEAKQGEAGFVESYKNFMNLAASHITVIAPFIPALAQMLK